MSFLKGGIYIIEISLCMIVKDEEKVLKRCLQNIQNIADEIIIVDTGSSDNTKQIASEFTDQIYDLKWKDDFSYARNYSLNKATKDYILWLDADDIIDQTNQQKLIELKRTLDKNIDIVLMKYKMGKDNDCIFYRERLIKNNKKHLFVNAIHETIPLIGNLLYSDITILHQKEKVNDPKRNLKIYQNMINQKIKLNTRDLFYFARELWYNQYYYLAIQCFNKFLIQKDAWVENKIEACLNLSSCYLETNQKEKALKILFQSFEYDIPRSEILCQIGHYFLTKNLITTAIYWYQLALKNHIDLKKGGFVQKDCYDFIPYIQLTLCYAKLNDLENAKKYNELAGKIKPNSPIYLHNQAILHS